MATVDPFLLAADRNQREAFGFITTTNIQSVSTLVCRLLFADSEFGAQNDPRRYTKVCCYEYAGYRPEVWTGQQAERVSLSLDGDERGAIQVVDTYGVWALDTHLKNQPPYKQDGLRDGMYLVISDHHLQARLRTPEGRLAWWHVELEEPPGV